MMDEQGSYQSLIFREGEIKALENQLRTLTKDKTTST